MWNSYADRNPSVVGDCSWEARAFAEDKGSATWPPRSYTCNFCMREFRSAQALGGHMNVHRRDRARLRQSAQPGTDPISHAASSATQHPMVFSSSEFVASGGMIFYSNQAGPVFLSAATDSTYRTDANFPMASSLLDKVGMFRDHDHDNDNNIGTDISADETFVTELDLELRLGW